MSVVEFFLSGANLPFVVALGVGVLYVLVSWSGVASLLGGGASSDADGHDGDAGDADGSGHGDADGDAGDADGGDAESDAGDGNGAHADAHAGGDADTADGETADADAAEANAPDADAADADAHEADAGDDHDADADDGDGDDGDDADSDDADSDDADGDQPDGDDPDGHHAAARGPIMHSQVHARAIASPRASAAVGGGKLPLSVRGPISLVIVGVTGLAANAVFFAETAAVPLLSLAWTAPLALGAAALGGRVLGRALAPILDDRASQATSRKDLVGCFGTVISSAVRPDFGEVRFRDRSGHQVRLVVKLAPDAPPLEEGDEAVVVDLDATGTPLVARLDLAPP